MANFLISYDLNGPRPSHAEVDAHIKTFAGHYARVLETVWWVGSHSETATSLRDKMLRIFSANDQIIVVRCSAGAWRKLKISDQGLLDAWNRYV